MKLKESHSTYIFVIWFAVTILLSTFAIGTIATEKYILGVGYIIANVVVFLIAKYLLDRTYTPTSKTTT